jgi:hypothetical protein
MIDLSFTQDSKWQKIREEQWKPTGKELKGSFSKNYIASIKSYFMTGILPEGAGFSDGAKLYYFPLKNTEGWDHVLENLVTSPDFLMEAVDCAFSGIQSFEFSSDEWLAYWDYFLPPIFKHTYEAKVLIAGTSAAEIVIDPLLHFRLYFGSISCFFKGLDSSVIFQRLDYFMSLFPQFTDDLWGEDVDRWSSEGITRSMIGRLFKNISHYDAPEGTLEFIQVRQDLLNTLEEKLDELYPKLCPKLQVLWNETKAKKAALIR